VRGDEARVVEAFCDWLQQEGWVNLRREVGFVDVIAERDGQTLYAEAKGRTAAIGSRRRHDVGPDPAAHAARRGPVPERVRRLLRIEIHAVSDSGGVERHG
jgi:hypothetical protein